MSGLKHTAQRAKNASMGKGYKTSKERRQQKKGKKQKKMNKKFENAVMPDEQEIRRNERRKAAARVGSRASTVMTDQETLG